MQDRWINISKEGNPATGSWPADGDAGTGAWGRYLVCLNEGGIKLVISSNWEPEGGYGGDGQEEFGGQWQDDDGYENHPTHWRLIPAPPEGE